MKNRRSMDRRASPPIRVSPPSPVLCAMQLNVRREIGHSVTMIDQVNFLLAHRRHNPVMPQVHHHLSIMIKNMCHGQR